VLFDQAEERGTPAPAAAVHLRTDLHPSPTAGGRDRRELLGSGLLGPVTLARITRP